MRFFEEMALSSATSMDMPTPRFWIRYVDDVLVIFNNGQEQVSNFLMFLNSLRESIQFTLEVEESGRLPFLDLLIKKVGGRLMFTVYRKPTHTDRYLSRDSCHPRTVFKSLVTCLKICHASWAGRVCPFRRAHRLGPL